MIAKDVEFGAECKCDDRETIAEKQRRWIIQFSHRYHNMESSGRVSGGIRKLSITSPPSLPKLWYPVYGSSLDGAVVLVTSDTRTAAYRSAYCIVLLTQSVAGSNGGGAYVIDTPPNPLGAGSENWSYFHTWPWGRATRTGGGSGGGGGGRYSGIC
jgi:hypothetical protein